MLGTGFEAFDHSVGGLLLGKVNTLLSDTPYARTYFVWRIVSSSLKKGNLVYYVDLDTMFTAFLANIRPASLLDDLVIFNPDREEIQDVISQICSVRTHNPDLVVFDSITVFYHLCEAKGGFGDVNRMLGLYISLFQNFASKMNTTVLFSSLARAKYQKTSWSPSYPGGRVLKKRSELIFSLTSSSGSIGVTVVKHPESSLQGIMCYIPVSEN